MTVDTVDFRRQMAAFAKRYGLDVKDFVRDQARLMAADMVKAFPPSKQMLKGVTGAGTGKEALGTLGVKSEKALGDRAVERGIRTVVYPMTPIEVRRAVDIKGERGAKLLHNEKTGAPWAVLSANYRPDAGTSTIKRKHRANRVRGRVPRNAAPDGALGTLPMSNKLHVRRANFNKYVRDAKKSVGRLKGGWAGAVVRLGGKPGPRWIARHTSGGTANGAINDDGNGVINVMNRVPYASAYRRIVAGGVRLREKKAAKRLKYIMGKLVREENNKRSA